MHIFNNNRYNMILFFVLLSFYSTFLIVEQRNYYYNAPLVCFLMGIGCAYVDIRRGQFAKRRLPLGIITAFSFYTLSALSIYFIHPEQFRLLKADLIPLLVIPIIYAVFSSSIITKQILIIFAVGAIMIGLVGAYDKYVLALPRALIERQPIIPAGGAAMILGLFCLSAAAAYKSRTKYCLFFIVAAIFGVFGSVLTGSRGTWLPLLIMIWVFAYKFSERRWHWFVTFIVVFVGLTAVVYFIPQTGVQARMAEAYYDIAQYFQGGNQATSIGLRFEFWKSALDGFIQRPWFGWGDQYQQLKDSQLAQGLIIKEAADEYFTHAHNQFLENMVKKGLLGLLALLALLLVPLRFYVSALKNSSSDEGKLLAELGIVLVLSTCLFSLSDVFLGLQLGMVFYAFTNAILIGLLSRNMSD